MVMQVHISHMQVHISKMIAIRAPFQVTSPVLPICFYTQVEESLKFQMASVLSSLKITIMFPSLVCKNEVDGSHCVLY